MGFHIRPLLFAAPLMLAAPVHAQQSDAPAGGFQLPPTGSAPTPNSSQQGPELNVYRDPVTPRATQPATPPVVVPTVTPPPATVQPTPQPSRPRPAPATTQTTTPAEPRATRPAERTTPTPPPAQTRPAPATSAAAPTPTETVPVETDASAANDSAPAAQPAQPLPTPAANAVASPEPAPAADATPEEEGISLPWIIAAAVAALVVLAGLVLLRRRRPAASRADAPVAQPKPAAPPPLAPATPPAPEPADTLHVPAAASVAAAIATDRPWLDMDMAVGQARYSLMGVTISYALILHNRGDRPAQDVLVRGMIGNGGAQQQAVLQGFFTGQDGLPLHSAVAIQPGETIQLSGELRLATDDIVPVEMGQRSLLIPLAAFDAAYRWDAEAADPVGQGRTARAFIVGQEQEPPAARLAPLRLDQGPRQYRRPAARAAAELTPA